VIAVPKVIAIGECMIELSGDPGGAFRLGYAGDTFNAAVYMARLGLDVAYATALGNDRFSDGAIAMMRSEGIDTALVERVAGRQPGLYLIETDAAGERRFAYWRDTAPIRDLFSRGTPPWRDALRQSDAVYLSGITLAVISEAGRRTLIDWLADAREGGATIVFDTNYRPQLWADPATARDAFETVIAQADMVSLSDDDAASLWPDGVLTRSWATSGVEVIRRRASLDVAITVGEETCTVPGRTATAVDTTGAGDSFNAAYLAARLAGAVPAAAAEAGHRLAAAVVRSPGAILPRDAMPQILPQAVAA
jgi:2-dehydro-3-deoxygluconokinase